MPPTTRSPPKRSRPEVLVKPGPEHPDISNRAPSPRHRHAKTGKTSRGERAIVLGPVISCVFIGVFLHFLIPEPASAVFVVMTTAASVLWIVVAGLALALDRSIRQGERSSFMSRDQTPGDEAGTDWDTRTGSFAWMRDWEDHQFNGDHHH